MKWRQSHLLKIKIEREKVGRVVLDLIKGYEICNFVDIAVQRLCIMFTRLPKKKSCLFKANDADK